MPLPPLSKEIQLILACARPCPDDAQAESIRQLVASGLNWNYLLKAASYHGMVPLLYHSLKKTAPESVPPAFSCELQKRYLINALRCTLLARDGLKATYRTGLWNKKEFHNLRYMGALFTINNITYIFIGAKANLKSAY